MAADPAETEALAAAVRELAERSRLLTHAQWRSPAAGGERTRAEVVLGLVQEWAVAGQVAEGVEPVRRPAAPAHPAALPDLLAVVGHDLVAARPPADVVRAALDAADVTRRALFSS